MGDGRDALSRRFTIGDLMHSYYIWPSIERGEFEKEHGGIRGSLEMHAQLLPRFGWVEVPTEEEADLVVGFLSTKSKHIDVFHLRGLYPTGEMEMPDNFWTANAKIIENIRRSRRVICVSEWVADILRRYMHLSPDVVPGHGLDLDAWDQIRAWDGMGGTPFVLWNKTRNYGVCDPTPLVQLANRMPDLRFVTTFLPPGVRTKPANVRVTGLLPYSEAWAVVKAAGAYLATTKETFGRGTLEAMASCPIAGYRWGATPDVVGNAAYLVEPDNLGALENALRAALADRDLLVKRARARLKERFVWEQVVAQTAAVYDRALAERQHSSPRVTVVIPCFNYERYVTDAIQSVFEQTFDDWELIVVDDGSTDKSVMMIERAIKYEERARLIQQENAGVAHARNTAIAQARGEFIACLDADDMMAPRFLEALVPALEADQALAIVYAGIELMRHDGSLRGHSHVWPKEYSKENGLRGNQIPTCCLYRRSWWKRVGGYRQRYAPYGAGQEDADFWFKILASGGGARKVTDEGLFRYRVHAQQTTRVHKEEWTKDRYLDWYPWLFTGKHPIATQLSVSPRGSWPVRNFDCPQVGVVIPVGPGHESVLVDALDSVEAQTFPLWEVIVVNDSGTPLDLTAWPFAKLIETKGGKGAGVARNLGIRALSAPLFVPLDADDVLQPEFISETLAVWEGDRWVYTDMFLIKADGRVERHDPVDWDIGELWRTGIAAVTCLYSTEMWERVGGFDEELRGREDWDFHLKLATHGYCGVRLAKPLFSYRHGTGGRRHIGMKHAEGDVLRKRYSMEVLMAGCRGCGARPGRRRRPRSQTVSPPAANWQSKEDLGWPMLEYTGTNPNALTFKGRTGRKYRFGNSEQFRFGRVHPDDVDRLLRFEYFRKAQRAGRGVLVAEPQPAKVERPVTKRRRAKPAAVPTDGDGRVPDVSKLSTRQLTALDLDRVQWAQMLQNEQGGKARKTAIAIIERKIRAAQGAA